MNLEKHIDRGFFFNVLDGTGLSLPHFSLFQKLRGCTAFTVNGDLTRPIFKPRISLTRPMPRVFAKCLLPRSYFADSQTLFISISEVLEQASQNKKL